MVGKIWSLALEKLDCLYRVPRRLLAPRRRKPK
jgi:hypothetical protein